jgi:hypothetical protein
MEKHAILHCWINSLRLEFGCLCTNLSRCKDSKKNCDFRPKNRYVPVHTSTYKVKNHDLAFSLEYHTPGQVSTRSTREYILQCSIAGFSMLWCIVVCTAFYHVIDRPWHCILSTVSFKYVLVCNSMYLYIPVRPGMYWYILDNDMRKQDFVLHIAMKPCCKGKPLVTTAREVIISEYVPIS